MLPRDFSTNQRVDRLPVLANSDAIVRSIGLDDGLHPDFGSGTWEGRPIGIPYDVVTRRTARERVRFGYADESDRVRYPIPRNVHIEGGGDRHALRVTVSRSRRAYVYPARHFASSDPAPSLPRMGERLRLKRGIDISGLPRQARVVAKALKRYGLIVADNGSDWYVSGAPHRGWDNDQLRRLGQLTGRDFEVVDARGLRPR